MQSRSSAFSEAVVLEVMLQRIWATEAHDRSRRPIDTAPIEARLRELRERVLIDFENHLQSIKIPTYEEARKQYGHQFDRYYREANEGPRYDAYMAKRDEVWAAFARSLNVPLARVTDFRTSHAFTDMLDMRERIYEAAVWSLAILLMRYQPSAPAPASSEPLPGHRYKATYQWGQGASERTFYFAGREEREAFCAMWTHDLGRGFRLSAARAEKAPADTSQAASQTTEQNGGAQ